MGGKLFQFLGSSEEDSEEENSGSDDGWSDLGSEGGSSAFSSDDVEQEHSKHPEFESEPTATKPQVNGSEPWQILQLRRQTLQSVMRQSAA